MRTMALKKRASHHSLKKLERENKLRGCTMISKEYKEEGKEEEKWTQSLKGDP